MHIAVVPESWEDSVGTISPILLVVMGIYTAVVVLRVLIDVYVAEVLEQRKQEALNPAPFDEDEEEGLDVEVTVPPIPDDDEDDEDEEDEDDEDDEAAGAE